MSETCAGCGVVVSAGAVRSGDGPLCDACNEPAVPVGSSQAGMPLAGTALVVALAPQCFSLRSEQSSSYTETINGVVVEETTSTESSDPFAIGGGALGVLLALVALVLARTSHRVSTSLPAGTIVFSVLALVLGAYHLLMGLGVLPPL